MDCLGESRHKQTYSSSKYVGRKCSWVSSVWDNTVFSMIRAVNTCDLRLITKETPENCDQYVLKEKLHKTVAETRVFWYDEYVFPRSLSRALKDPAHAVLVNCTLLSKGHYFDQASTVLFRILSNSSSINHPIIRLVIIWRDKENPRRNPSE